MWKRFLEWLRKSEDVIFEATKAEAYSHLNIKRP